jgi:hypothetical protein
MRTGFINGLIEGKHAKTHIVGALGGFGVLKSQVWD